MFKFKVLLGKVILLKELLILLIQYHYNKNNIVISDHTGLNIHIAAQNLGFCCADTLSYTCKLYTGCV